MVPAGLRRAIFPRISVQPRVYHQHQHQQHCDSQQIDPPHQQRRRYPLCEPARCRGDYGCSALDLCEFAVRGSGSAERFRRAIYGFWPGDFDCGSHSDAAQRSGRARSGKCTFAVASSSEPFRGNALDTSARSRAVLGAAVRSGEKPGPSAGFANDGATPRQERRARSRIPVGKLCRGFSGFFCKPAGGERRHDEWTVLCAELDAFFSSADGPSCRQHGGERTTRQRHVCVAPRGGTAARQAAFGIIGRDVSDGRRIGSRQRGHADLEFACEQRRPDGSPERGHGNLKFSYEQRCPDRSPGNIYAAELKPFSGSATGKLER
jgi:hypothetical protein